MLNCKTSDKKWKYINKTLGRDQIQPKIKLGINNSIITDPKQVANTFNEYFNRIPTEIHNNLSQSNNNYINLVPINNHSIFFNPTISFEIEEIVNNLSNSNSMFDVPTKFMKLVIPHISDMLADFINLCVEEGVFPHNLKCARIVPVYKNGGRDDYHNYRPISILLILEKIFEKIIYKRLYSFFTDSNVISPNQFGYRKNMNTTQAVLKFISDTLPVFNYKLYSGAIFVDYSKAFDTVPHDLLLKKLHRYGVRGITLRLIKSYLLNRQHFTSVNGIFSDIKTINTGVPQGSCLGPLLYLIYTNDINNLFDNSSLVIYADDTAIIIKSLNMNNLELSLNEKLKLLYDWSNFNKLAINKTKTKYMVLSPLYKDNIEVKLENEILEKANVFKYLGIYIDDILM